MLNIRKIIYGEMGRREKEFISFIDLVQLLRTLNKEKIGYDEIKDFLQFKLKKTKQNTLLPLQTFYIEDLSDINCDIERIPNEEFFQFLYKLSDHFLSTPSESIGYNFYFLKRMQLSNLLGVDISLSVQLEKLGGCALGDYNDMGRYGIEIKNSEITTIEDNKNLLQQLTAKDEEIAKLKAEIKSLQQAQAKISELEKQLEQAQSVQLPPMVEDEGDNYNPKERETHLKLIYALTMARTNKDFSASAYFNNKGMLKTSTMMNDLINDFEESGIQGFSADSLRKKLAEILKMEELQTMMGKNH